MEHFTPVSATLGGALIGLAAVVLMLSNGRVAGISGITVGVLSFLREAPERGWRIAFLAGLIAAPFGFVFVTGSQPVITYVTTFPFMMLAGLIVGFGVVLGNGCTSGHGVCGLARFSRRSIIATAVFMTSAIATTFLVRHIVAGG